jgi:hypothetical protein
MHQLQIPALLNMRLFLRSLPLFILIAVLASCFNQKKEEGQNKTVLIAILARNKAHVLPLYLDCIENLDYNKKLISLYINTNNNVDKTQEILEEWVKKHEHQYQKILFETHEVSEEMTTKPHDWDSQRFTVLGKIRNTSLEKAKAEKSDFYFVIDCDNFITPCTLKELIKKDKPIIAPMLRAIGSEGDTYSNFFAAINSHGYWASHSGYHKILNREWVGTFQVPVVHCTYLIKADYLNDLTYQDDTDDYEFVIFSRSAREKHIGQYICNEKNFGLLLHFYDDDLSLEEEADRVRSSAFQDWISELKVVYTCCPTAIYSGENEKWHLLQKGFYPYLDSYPLMNVNDDDNK